MNTPGFAPEWLALREQADAAARSSELIDLLCESLGEPNRLIIRDLGCGTGSMGRWLAGRLDGPQHWVLQDRDSRLLSLAGASMTGSGITAETLEGDVTALHAGDLVGISLVTTSALLDLLTADEVKGLAEACAEASCPALFTLSVTGRVNIDPAEPLDAEFEEAFNAHQTRVVDGRRLLGPDALAAAVEAFEALGAVVSTRPSPWRLGPQQAGLAREWLRGWVGAACEQEPSLSPEAPAYLRRRLAGELRVVVGHSDFLAIPRAA
jgi:hypothetical protein